MNRRDEMYMSEPLRAPENNQTESDKGPTEKLRERKESENEQGVPGAQNPESDEIKNEQQPNTE
jgi:hypothetical protein